MLYPDFTTYTVSGVENFCEENGVTLNIEYQETTLSDPGTIISQSRAPGNVVRANTTLTIVVTKVPSSALDAESSSEE